MSAAKTPPPQAQQEASISGLRRLAATLLLLLGAACVLLLGLGTGAIIAAMAIVGVSIGVRRSFRRGALLGIVAAIVAAIILELGRPSLGYVIAFSIVGAPALAFGLALWLTDPAVPATVRGVGRNPRVGH